jgi:hypothetical protein
MFTFDASISADIYALVDQQKKPGKAWFGSAKKVQVCNQFQGHYPGKGVSHGRNAKRVT